MSGLDSIALAVAHLEERQKETSNPAKPSILNRNSSDASAASSVIAMPLAASATMPSATAATSASAAAASLSSTPPPPPRALHVPPARVISVDEASLNASAASASAAASAFSANAIAPSSNSTFGYILADPIKWLQKTQDRPPLQPPADFVQKVEPTDVLCGRGGETNHHPGNVQYRLLVKAFQPLYVSAKRRDKPLIAQCIVYSVRQVGGRFLKRASDKEWKDVGNTKAREKTSQALREGAPELRGDAVPKMMPKQQMLLPVAPAPQMSQIPAAPAPGQPMSFVEARFLSALLAQQAALTRSVVVNQQQHPQLQHAHQPGPSHPMAPAVTNSILPQKEYPQQQQQYQAQPQPQPQELQPQQQQQQSLPTLQPTAAVPQAPPSTTAQQQQENNTRKRPVVVSDSHSDSDSIGSSASSKESKGIPLKKRFKMRFQQESSSSA
ncbi:MAG: hypothetical protein SGBAC_010890 [Bacillariaceae sp.]